MIATPIVSYTYDSLSRRDTTEYANGTTIDYDYDIANRLLNITNQTNTHTHSFDYTYDDVGNRLTMTVDGTEVHTYTYDNIYQLTDVDYPEGYFAADTTFNYDPAGNRDDVVHGEDYVTNNLNQYTDVDVYDFEYDDNGNLDAVKFGQTTLAWYHYNSENRMTHSYLLGTGSYYAYDFVITKYCYDGDQVIAEYEDDVLVRKFVYGPGIDEVVRMTHPQPSADITDDGVVNIDDLNAMAEAWLLEDTMLWPRPGCSKIPTRALMPMPT